MTDAIQRLISSGVAHASEWLLSESDNESSPSVDKVAQPPSLITAATASGVEAEAEDDHFFDAEATPVKAVDPSAQASSSTQRDGTSRAKQDAPSSSRKKKRKKKNNQSHASHVSKSRQAQGNAKQGSIDSTPSEQESQTVMTGARKSGESNGESNVVPSTDAGDGRTDEGVTPSVGVQQTFADQKDVSKGRRRIRCQSYPALAPRTDHDHDHPQHKHVSFNLDLNTVKVYDLNVGKKGKGKKNKKKSHLPVDIPKLLSHVEQRFEGSGFDIDEYIRSHTDEETELEVGTSPLPDLDAATLLHGILSPSADETDSSMSEAAPFDGVREDDPSLASIEEEPTTTAPAGHLSSSTAREGSGKKTQKRRKRKKAKNSPPAASHTISDKLDESPPASPPRPSVVRQPSPQDKVSSGSGERKDQQGSGDTATTTQSSSSRESISLAPDFSSAGRTAMDSARGSPPHQRTANEASDVVSDAIDPRTRQLLQAKLLSDFDQPRHDAYQTDTRLVINIFRKGCSEDTVKWSLFYSGDNETTLVVHADDWMCPMSCLGRLNAEAPASVNVRKTKVEVFVLKQQPGQWKNCTRTVSFDELQCSLERMAVTHFADDQEGDGTELVTETTDAASTRPHAIATDGIQALDVTKAVLSENSSVAKADAENDGQTKVPEARAQNGAQDDGSGESRLPAREYEDGQKDRARSHTSGAQESLPSVNVDFVHHRWNDFRDRTEIILDDDQIVPQSVGVDVLSSRVEVSFVTNEPAPLGVSAKLEPPTRLVWTFIPFADVKTATVEQLRFGSYKIGLQKMERKRWRALESISASRGDDSSSAPTAPASTRDQNRGASQPAHSLDKAHSGRVEETAKERLHQDDSSSSDPTASSKQPPSNAASPAEKDESINSGGSGSQVPTQRQAFATRDKKGPCSLENDVSSMSEKAVAQIARFVQSFHPQSGTIGLPNLGQTCYLNCVLQCLAQTQECRDYFGSGAFAWAINRSAKSLGSQGKIAMAFAAVVKQLWSDNKSGVSKPLRSLKRSLAEKHEQYFGYRQHDAHELLECLLDELHEDVNRVKEKPYVPVPDDDDDDGDGDGENCGSARSSQRPVAKDVNEAREAWTRFRQREDSVIVDLFQGMLRSEVQCPSCNRTSVTFDPYRTLSVPIIDPPRVTLVRCHMELVQGEMKVQECEIEYQPGTDSVLCAAKTALTTLRQCQNEQPYDVSCGILDGQKLRAISNSAVMPALSPRQTLEVFVTGSDSALLEPAPLENTADTSHLARGQLATDYIHVCVYQRVSESLRADTCASCGANAEHDSQTFRRCSRCQCVYYCSLDCQKTHWSNRHKRDCGKAQLVSHPFILRFPENATLGHVGKLVQNASKCRLKFADHVSVTFRLSEVTTAGMTVSKPSVVTKAAKAKDILDWRRVTHIAADWIVARSGSETEAVADECPAKPTDSFSSSPLWTDLVAKLLKQTPAVANDNGSKSETLRQHHSHDGVATLEDCLSAFSRREVLGQDDGWYCSRCKAHQRASKQLSIWDAPPVLVLHLKRFSALGRKTSNLVSVPTQLDMSPFVKGEAVCQAVDTASGDPEAQAVVDYRYALYGVANHYGSMHFGHYTAMTQHQVDGQWRCYDDDRVSKPLKALNIDPKAAYILFYRRVSDQPQSLMVQSSNDRGVYPAR